MSDDNLVLACLREIRAMLGGSQRGHGGDAAADRNARGRLRLDVPAA